MSKVLILMVQARDTKKQLDQQQEDIISSILLEIPWLMIPTRIDSGISN
jgi:hypothetical protein